MTVPLKVLTYRRFRLLTDVGIITYCRFRLALQINCNATLFISYNSGKFDRY